MPKPWLNPDMNTHRHFAAASLLACAAMLALSAAVLAQADTRSAAKKAPPGCGPRVIVEYTDDDPDYFIIKNRSPEGWSLVKLGIDLAHTASNLVFDPESGGPGVGGAAEFYAGDKPDIRLTGTVPAQDGGKTLALSFEGFAPGRDYDFSVDLDTLGRNGGTTWVLPQDMEGARAIATFRGPVGQEDTIDAIFDETATADSGAGGCV